jgi:hypothetical protein
VSKRGTTIYESLPHSTNSPKRSDQTPTPKCSIATTLDQRNGVGDASQVSTVPVIGGSGRYLAALGSASRSNVGLNNTSLSGIGSIAPNFRYEFDLFLVG